MIHDLKGKTVFITGCASGIGKAQATAFLTQGASVFGMDIKHDVHNLTSQFPATFHFHLGNVSKKKDVLSCVNLAIKELGTIDILINTAGILDQYKPSLETDEALWQHILQTNLTGTYFTTNAILPHMLKKGKGTIINMASIAGLVAGGGGAAYTTSKHAIIGYTKQLDYDYAKQGIRANAIAPGAIQTPMNQADFAGDGEMAQWVAKETPAGRWAAPDEVANLTLFIASDLADYIHGSVLPIDGGWTEK